MVDRGQAEADHRTRHHERLAPGANGTALDHTPAPVSGTGVLEVVDVAAFGAALGRRGAGAVRTSSHERSGGRQHQGQPHGRTGEPGEPSELSGPKSLSGPLAAPGRWVGPLGGTMA